MEKFDYVYVNNNNVLINDFYRMTINELDKLKSINDYENKVIKYLQPKLVFTQQVNNLPKHVIVGCFSNSLLFEIEHNKDIAMYSLDDIKQLLEHLKTNNVFNSVSTVFNYYRTISMYTEFAYENRYRNDYYNVSDISKLIPMCNILNDNEEVYTVKELKSIADEVERKDVQIAILLLLEGLKSDDILDLKRKDFETPINKIVTLENGKTFNLSDELYMKCYEYANEEFIELRSRGGYVQKKLNNSEYLFRASFNARSEYNAKMNASQLANNVKRSLVEIGVNIEMRAIRVYAMINDLINGYSVEDINMKYYTKYKHELNVYRNKNIYDKMIDKIKDEGR